MSLLNTSENFDWVSPRTRQKQSVKVGRIMHNTEAADDNRRKKKSGFNRRKRTPSKNQKINSTNQGSSADRIQARRSKQGPDLGTMPIMFEVDEEESSISTSGNRDLTQSSSFHTARSTSRSRSLSRHGSSEPEDDSIADVIGGEYIEDHFQIDKVHESSESSEVPMDNAQVSSGFQLDMVPATPEHRIRAVLKTGVNHSGAESSPRPMPSLSLNDDSEEGGEEEESEEQESEESDFEEGSDEDVDEVSSGDDGDDDDESDDGDSDDEDSDDDDDDKGEESDEESDEEISEATSSEASSETVDQVPPPTIDSNENSSSEFNSITSSPLPQMTPSPRPRQRMQPRDPTESRNAPPSAVHLDSLPTSTQQRERNRDPGRQPRGTLSNALQLDAPPAQTRERTSSQDRIPLPQDTLTLSLQLDAPSAETRPRAGSQDRIPPPKDIRSNSLELDAPPTRQRRRMRSHDTQEETEGTISNSLQLDAQPTRQRQRVRSHESQDTDEEEAADTISDLPMPAPRTRTRTRQPRQLQQAPNRMMSLDTFAVGNLVDTLQVDQTAPPQQGAGRRRMKAPARIKSMAISQDKPALMLPKQRMPPERRLSLDSRRHVYDNDDRFNKKVTKEEPTSFATPSGTPSDNAPPSPVASPKTTKSFDELEASPDAKNRRRLRSADDLAELRTPDFDSEAASGRPRRSMFKRRVSGGRDDSPKREKASYLLGMHKGSVAQGRELESTMLSRSPHKVSPSMRGGPMSTRQPRQRPAPNRYKPLPPPPSNDDLDIDDMIAIRRSSAQLSNRVSDVRSDDTISDDHSVDSLEKGEATPNLTTRKKNRNHPRERSTEMDQKDPTQLNEKQFWLIVTGLTTLGVIFGFVAVKVS
ncbi:MAG: hypothetical protein SGBAC_008415 [Bacillariaceae sp.]